MNKALKNRVNQADDITFLSNEYSSIISLTDSARHARLGSTVFIIFKTGLTNMTNQSYIAYIHGRWKKPCRKYYITDKPVANTHF